MKRLFAMIKSLFAQSGDMMDVDEYPQTMPCANCLDGQATIYPAVEIHNH